MQFRQVLRSGVAVILVAGSVQAQEVRINDRTFEVHPDFELSAVTTTELTQRPINASLDEQGRLYVSESSGSNEPVTVQLEKKPHSILRLEDVDGDGVFDRRSVFAERMMFPEGTLWFQGSLYVAAPPQIWKLTDTTGDGRADQREVWFDGRTLTGCANDLHGPYLGRDGWIYWCKGAFAEQTYERPGREPFVTRASHIFRARPDGSGVEPVMTGGMDNPVDVAFSPAGERFFTTTFLQHPGGGKRDGIIHAIYGGVYGKDHSVLDGHPRTDPRLMPPLIHLGAAAPSGLDAVDLPSLFGGNAPGDYDCALVASQFNKHCISLHLLTEQGASYSSTDVNLVVSDHPDFHPTDVFQDSDGSLLIVDTGGWYKLCCPTSQLMKPDVPGAIYRLRAKRATRRESSVPDLESTRPGKLVSLLSDSSPAVVEQASRRLAALGDAAVASVREGHGMASPSARMNRLWVLSRIGSRQALKAVRELMQDEPQTRVRRVGAHVLGLYRDADSLPVLVRDLTSRDAHLARAAAEAVGRIGTPAAVEALLSAIDSGADRALAHSRIYALIEARSPKATKAGLRGQSSASQAAALIALDQMKDDLLHPSDVLPRLTARDRQVAEAAEWIATRHNDWAPELADWLGKQLQAESTRGELSPALLRAVARSAEGQELLLAEARRSGGGVRSVCLKALAALPASEFREPTRRQLVTMARQPEASADMLRALAASVNPKSPDPECVAALLECSRFESLRITDRLLALRAALPGLREIDSDTFALLIEHIDADREVGLRTRSAEILASARLSVSQRMQVAGVLPHAGLQEAPGLLRVFEKQSSPRLGLALVESLEESVALNGVHAGQLREVLASYPAEVQQRAVPLFQRLQADFQSQQETLAEIERTLPPGNVRRGQRVFMGTKAGCYSCHEIGYLGGDLGPDLTRIGRIRTKRDLLEAVIFPSASLVRSYEPVTVVTSSGKTHSGLLKREANGDLVVIQDATTRVAITGADVEEIVPSPVSVMPKGVDKLLSKQELADLIEFLMTRK